MSLNIIKYPDRVVNNNNDTISKWNAVHHPITFDLKREDYPVQLFYNNTTKVLTAAITVGNVIDSFEPGDEIYVECANGGAVFTLATYTFPNIFVFEPQVVPFIFSQYGFINVLTRINYFILVNVWKINDNNQYELIGTSTHKPSGTGVVKADVSTYLKSLVSYVDEFQYNKLNELDKSLGDRYNLTYSENWLGFEGEFSVMSSTILRYMVNAAKQIQDLYGENMGEYVPFNNYAAEDVRAKFLSDFKSPTYFPGYPFSMSFIYSEGLANTKTYKKESKLDINNNQIALTTKELDNSQLPFVNRLLIDTDYSKTIECIEVWLENSNEASLPTYFTPGYVKDGYVGGPDPVGPVDSGLVESQQSATT